MAGTLFIDITAVDANGRPTTFEKNASSDASKATVDSSGNIDVSQCTSAIVISWTFAESTGQHFVHKNDAPAITFAPAKGADDNKGIFGDIGLSNSNRTATLRDFNPTEENRGANANRFNYTIHDEAGPDDPSIQNR